MNSWARQDPQAAQTWLETQPASMTRDAAAGEYVDVVAARDPQLALRLGDLIEDEHKREAALEITVEGLLWEDPESAAETMMELNLSVETQDRLEKRRVEFATWKRLAIP